VAKQTLKVAVQDVLSKQELAQELTSVETEKASTIRRDLS